jgi:hypothetical protein
MMSLGELMIQLMLLLLMSLQLVLVVCVRISLILRVRLVEFASRVVCVILLTGLSYDMALKLCIRVVRVAT